MLINKEHKLKAILDIKKGRITGEVARHLQKSFVLIDEKGLKINGVKYDQAIFDEIRNYIENVLKIHCIYSPLTPDELERMLKK